MDIGALLRVVGYAHRGLHAVAGGAAQAPVENSLNAVMAAVEAGVGIEIDVQMSRDDVPVVFHDETLTRLAGRDDDVSDLPADELAAVKLTGSEDLIMTLADCLRLVDGRVPMLIELKSRWGARAFQAGPVCRVLQYYDGPAGVMSFDPAIIEAMRFEGCSNPCGLVTAARPHAGWPKTDDEKEPAREDQFSHARRIGVSFLAHDVGDVENGRVADVAADIGVPLFSWTVKTAAHLKTARAAGAVPIFEGQEVAAQLLPMVHQDL